MKRGLPRPRTHVERVVYRELYPNPKKWDNRYYPHPYNASDDDVAIIGEGRLRQSVIFKLCGVCGELVEDEEVGLVLYNYESSQAPEWETHKDWVMSESGPYHLPCLQIAFTMCPHLADTDKYFPGYGSWPDVREQVLNYIL